MEKTTEVESSKTGPKFFYAAMLHKGELNNTGNVKSGTDGQGGNGQSEDTGELNSRLSLTFVVLTLVIATISARSVNNMVITTIPFLAKYTFSFSNAFVGLLSAVLNISTFAVTSYLNPHMRSSTRRKVFILSSGSIPVILFLYYLSTPVMLWPVSIVSGLAFGVLFPNIITSATLHGDHLVQMRLLAIYSLSLSLSLVMGPSIETWLLTFLGYKQIFLPFILIALAGFLASPFIKFPEARREITGRAALRNRGLISAILAITIYNVPFAAITSFLVIFAVGKFSISSSTAYSVFIYFFFTSFAARLSMAIKPLNNLFAPLVIASSITVLCLGLIPFMNSFLFFILVITLLGIPHGAIFPMASMLIARGTTPAERSVANSYFMAYNNSLFIAVPVVIGIVSDIAGFTFSFIVLAIASTVSAGMLTVVYRNNTHLFSRNAGKNTA